VQPSILPATGAASSITISMAGLLSGLAFYALAAL
jgi:LPXTG-motif cell wall-anchored protein